MEAHQPDDREQRANELYWESERSVNAIAELLDLSKGTLYGLIRPLPTGLPCPRCTKCMEYPNRTARDRGLLACPGCGHDQDEEEVRRSWSDAAARSPGGKLVVTPEDAAADSPRRPEEGEGVRAPARPRPPRARPDRALIGAGLLAAAAGIWLVRRLRGD